MYEASLGPQVKKEGHWDEHLLKENALCHPSAECFVDYLPFTGEISDVELKYVLISCSV